VGRSLGRLERHTRLCRHRHGTASTHSGAQRGVTRQRCSCSGNQGETIVLPRGCLQNGSSVPSEKTLCCPDGLWGHSDDTHSHQSRRECHPDGHCSGSQWCAACRNTAVLTLQHQPRGNHHLCDAVPSEWVYSAVSVTQAEPPPDSRHNPPTGSAAHRSTLDRASAPYPCDSNYYPVVARQCRRLCANYTQLGGDGGASVSGGEYCV
jgi:hypothetical protein